MNAALASLLARAAFMHYDDPTWLIHFQIVSMVHDPYELFADNQ